MSDETLSPEINVGGLKHARVVADLLATLRQPVPEGAGNWPLRAAEVGVYRGRMSAYLLANVPDLHLVMVDPWAAVAPDTAYAQTGDSCAALTQAQQTENMNIAIGETQPWWQRRTLVIEPSVEAAKRFADGYFDLVFIDGAHDVASVSADNAAWWPKVRPGGILAGHDYRAKRHRKGVVEAVDAFVAETGLTLELGNGKVWWVRKPA